MPRPAGSNLMSDGWVRNIGRGLGLHNQTEAWPGTGEPGPGSVGSSPPFQELGVGTLAGAVPLTPQPSVCLARPRGKNKQVVWAQRRGRTCPPQHTGRKNRTQARCSDTGWLQSLCFPLQWRNLSFQTPSSFTFTFDSLLYNTGFFISFKRNPGKNTGLTTR